MALTAEMLAIITRDYLAGIKLNHVRWVNTRNPIYVWQAINLSFALGAMEVQLRAGAKSEEPPGSEPHPLPAWCLVYLGTIASRIGVLADGIDFRKMPRPFGDVEPSTESWRNAAEAQPTLAPSEARDLTAQALSLSRPGWNAFERYSAVEGMEMDAFSDEALRFEGKTASEAMRINLEESGVADERTMRRRIAESRRARGEKKPKPTA